VMRANSRKEKTVKEVSVSTASTSVIEYRESVRKLIDSEVKKALEEEVQKAVAELIEEQRKTIRLMLEEHKAAIEQVVAEEKKEIWEKTEALRQTILKMGL
jgi:hypothetical protein